MRELKHLTECEIDKADLIIMDGNKADEDELAELIDLSRQNGVIYKYEFVKNDSGKLELRIW